MTSGSGWEEDLRRRLHGIFLGEAAERLEALEAAVRGLAGGAAGAEVDRHLSDAFRHAHTLKGGARAVGLPDVERLSEALETLFDRLRSGAPAGRETWAAVSAAVETLRGQLAGEPVDVDAAVAAVTAVVSPAG